MKKYRGPLWAVLLLFLLSACGEHKEAGLEVTTEPAEKSPAPLVVSPLSKPAGLRDVLPGNAMAYLRLPNPWGFLSAPKGNSLGKALSDSAHLDGILALHQGISRQLLKGREVLPDPVLDLFLMQLRSPLELAVLSADDSQPLTAAVLASAVIAPSSVTELNIWLNLIASHQPALKVLLPVAENGRGQLSVNGVPAFLRFDVTTQTLLLMAGLAVTEAVFEESLAGLSPRVDHPMYALEAEIDTSRQGLFYWVDMERVMPMLKTSMPPVQLRQIEANHLDQVKTVAMGWGVSNGKGRLRLSVEVADSALQQWLEPFDNQWTVTAAGQPHTVLTFSLPSAGQLLEIEQRMLDAMPVSSSIQYRQFTQALEQTWGFPGSDWLHALGNELLVFSDDVGEYLAVEIRDAAKLEQLLLTLAGQEELRYSVRQVKGAEIHNMVLPQIVLSGNQEAIQKLPPLLRKLVLNGKSHLYWLREGNYLVFAGVPQLLLDRAAHPQRTVLGTWLREQQRQQGSQSLLLVSTRIDQAPRRAYYAYLHILTYLADLAEVELDLFTLPTARELDLPAQGTFGAQLDVSPGRLGLEMTFESTPFDLFMDPGSGGVVAIAMVGITAAIAVPAYHDYTLRVKVAGGITEASEAKAAVSRFHAQAGRFPAADEIVQLGLAPGRSVKLSLVPDTGVVVITFQGDKKLAGKRVVLVPQASPQGLDWRCKGELEARLLPTACR